MNFFIKLFKLAACSATPRYAALRRATPRYAALRRATPRYAALRRATRFNIKKSFFFCFKIKF
jgi:hypothetical protein